MEDEIDLREYVWVLLRRWRLIVGLTVVAALTALGTSLLLPPSYEATALVAVTRPRYALQFEPRIEALEDPKPAYAAYPQLATSDEVLGRLLAALNPLPEGVERLRDLREMVKAKAGADPSIVQLSVRAPEAQVAARVANAWAEVFVGQANALYGLGGDEQLAFFAGQAEQARKTLAEAEQALTEFQARNQTAIFEVRLGALKGELGNLLAERAGIAQAVRKAQALQARVAGQPAGSRARLADELTALLLQAEVYGLRASAGEAGGAEGRPPIQLQLSGAGLPESSQTAAELGASIGELVGSLEAQVEKLDARARELQPEILALQSDLQEAQAEEGRLVRERDVAQEAYVSLAQKVAETRIAAEDPESEVRLASRAAVPERPVAQGKAASVVIAGMLGLMLGVFGTFVIHWWQGDVQQQRGVDKSVRSGASRPATGGAATR